MKRAIYAFNSKFAGTGPLSVGSVLSDHGLKSAGSITLNGDYHHDAVVCLEGEALPAECEHIEGEPLKRVEVWFKHETYGNQRMVKVQSIAVVPGSLADLLPFK